MTSGIEESGLSWRRPFGTPGIADGAGSLHDAALVQGSLEPRIDLRPLQLQLLTDFVRREGSTAGQPAKVRLDGFPELLFNGRVELVTPLAMPSEMSQTVRTFTAVIAIEGTHEQLLPDLTASVEILPEGGR